MTCLWPIRGTMVGAVGVAVLWVVFGRGAAGDVSGPARSAPARAPLAQREKGLRRVAMHTSEFAPIYESMALPNCRNARPPEALLTPDPVVQTLNDDGIRVSFIVGADGRVHSAFILNSGGRVGDQMVLRAVRHWRYRPARCNGVPTDMEAQVSFTPR